MAFNVLNLLMDGTNPRDVRIDEGDDDGTLYGFIELFVQGKGNKILILRRRQGQRGIQIKGTMDEEGNLTEISRFDETGQIADEGTEPMDDLQTELLDIILGIWIEDTGNVEQSFFEQNDDGVWETSDDALLWTSLDMRLGYLELIIMDKNLNAWTQFIANFQSEKQFTLDTGLLEDFRILKEDQTLIKNKLQNKISFTMNFRKAITIAVDKMIERQRIPDNAIEIIFRTPRDRAQRIYISKLRNIERAILDFFKVRRLFSLNNAEQLLHDLLITIDADILMLKRMLSSLEAVLKPLTSLRMRRKKIPKRKKIKRQSA